MFDEPKQIPRSKKIWQLVFNKRDRTVTSFNEIDFQVVRVLLN